MDTKETFRFVKVTYDPLSPFEYSYLDRERIATKGDYVWVPVGRFNEEKLAHVVGLGDYTRENAPYPVERTKAIIRLANASEAKSADEAWAFIG